MEQSADDIDLTTKLNFSEPLMDDSSINPNNVGLSNMDISDTIQTENETINDSCSKSQNNTKPTKEHETIEVNGKLTDTTANWSVSLSSLEKKRIYSSNKTTEVEQMQNEPTTEDILMNDTSELMAEPPEESLSLVISERDFFKNSFVELGRRLWKSNAEVQQYTKGCLWSPDGTCLLIPVHMDGMHVIELPLDLYKTDEIALDRNVNSLDSAIHVKEGGTVYDCAWYPHMNSHLPETCCWIASRQHEPIHMWDAFNGELRCTYRGYDDVDEVQAAISVIFSNDGEKIYGGYKKSIKIFDTTIPGRDSNSIPVKQAISCFALNDSNDSTITAGSWNGSINHYDLRVPKIGPLFTLTGHTGGVTWMRYAPEGQDNWLLFSGARKDNKILQWDMRNYTEPVFTFTRFVETNQRIYFDISPQCEWLVSGDTTGILRIWDLCGDSENIEVKLHQDCCNGVNFHPSLPILATSSGQYHFQDITCEDDEDVDKNVIVQETPKKETTINYENSLLFLWFDKNQAASTITDEAVK